MFRARCDQAIISSSLNSIILTAWLVLAISAAWIVKAIPAAWTVKAITTTWTVLATQPIRIVEPISTALQLELIEFY